ncbi:MAG: sugar phosphate isomerase/epimerase [Planctomycetaceae bacterium]|nr:sugar phosphate isomerase/epimerase [Planctomycetaceae bacterium]
MTDKRIRLAVAAAETASRREPVPLTGPFGACARRAAAHGFDALEIHLRDPLAVDAAALRSACDETGLSVSALATGRSYAVDGLCLVHPDPAVREKAADRLIDFVELAAAFRADVLIGRMKGDIPAAARAADYEDMLADGLRPAGEAARDAGVNLVLEAINRYESNYMNTGAEVRRFILDHDLPATRLLLDVFHMNIEETDIVAAVRKNHDVLGYFHIADSNRRHPGAGHVEVATILRTLLAVGYDGVISLECLPEPDGDAALVQTMVHVMAVM